MQPHFIALHYRDDGKSKSSSAQIIVPGLGKVDIENALSVETMDRVAVEAMESLRLKMGMKLCADPSRPDQIFIRDLVEPKTLFPAETVEPPPVLFPAEPEPT